MIASSAKGRARNDGGVDRGVMGLETTFRIIPYGSAEYKNAVRLRDEVLRKPLGLSLSPEELQIERDYFHVVGCQAGKVVATALLIPEGTACKMRQVAVRDELRSTGIGSQMMRFCEGIAKEKGVKSLYCHARHTAVSFYLKNAYQVEGNPFEENTIPHVKMRKMLGE